MIVRSNDWSTFSRIATASTTLTLRCTRQPPTYSNKVGNLWFVLLRIVASGVEAKCRYGWFEPYHSRVPLMPNNSWNHKKRSNWPVTNHEKPIAILSTYTPEVWLRSPLKSCREPQKAEDTEDRLPGAIIFFKTFLGGGFNPFKKY